MPIYTYRCESCGVQFDRTQKFTDNPLTQCPECGKKTLRKVYSPVGIVFKGSGFYATDHHSPSGQSWASGSKEPASEAKAEAAEAKADAKPETKTKTDKPKENSKSAESKSSTKE
jgi:putative FmdB family regulatory protein